MNELKYPVVKEGFRASREYLNFRTQTTLQLEAAIAGMFTAPSFIVGGAITINSESEFSISDGVLAIGGKLYHLQGDVYDGAPGDYQVEYKNQVSAAYPQQDHGSTGNVGVLEDVFFENVAFLTDNPEGTSIALTSIDHVDLSDIVASVADNADGIDANSESINDLTPTVVGVSTSDITFTNVSAQTFFGFSLIKKSHTVNVNSSVHLKVTANSALLKLTIAHSIVEIGTFVPYHTIYVPQVSAGSIDMIKVLIDKKIGGSVVDIEIRKTDNTSFAINDEFIFMLSCELSRT